MAGFGWNMRQGNNSNVHELNNNHARKRPFAATQIACRICDRVFFSNQALINHLETHMVDDETATTRSQNEINLMFSQRDHHQPFGNNPNFQPPNFTQQPIQSGYNNISQERNVPLFGPSPRSLLRPFPTPPVQLSSLKRRQLEFEPHGYRNEPGPQAQTVRFKFLSQQRTATEERASIDYTKPFLDQLQKKIPDIEKYVERDDGNNRVRDLEMLDLTLKL